MIFSSSQLAGEFRFPGPACPVPVPAAPAIPVEDVPGAFRSNVQRVQRRTVRAAIGRGHLLISGAQFFVVFRPAAHFRGLLPTVPVNFLRFAISGLFGIVVMRAGRAVDRHPDLLLLPALTVHPATAHPKICWDMTRAYAETRSAKEHVDKPSRWTMTCCPRSHLVGVISADTLAS